MHESLGVYYRDELMFCFGDKSKSLSGLSLNNILGSGGIFYLRSSCSSSFNFWSRSLLGTLCSANIGRALD